MEPEDRPEEEVGWPQEMTQGRKAGDNKWVLADAAPPPLCSGGTAQQILALNSTLHPEEQTMTALGKSRNRQRITIILVVLLVLGSLAAALIVPVLSSTGHRLPASIKCQRHLKNIGMALRIYSAENDGWFPPDLETIRQSGYPDARFFRCPGTIRRKRWFWQREDTAERIDYHYRPGLNEFVPESYRVPIVWDLPTNHSGYGNVLFVDGHVNGYVGNDWMQVTAEKQVTTD